jgi:tetratricopeptide (TPR) repeat protein
MDEETPMIKRIWPFLVSMGGASVMLLAFFIPSLQDQWDRYQSRKVIEQYEALGNAFYDEERYEMAEEAYTKAFVMSEEKRLDIEMKRLDAKINRLGNDPSWGTKPPEDIKEIDFQMLLHMQGGVKHLKHRGLILNSYGVYLAGLGRTDEASDAFEEALKIDPRDVMAYINRGNLFDQLGKPSDAETDYRKAIALDSSNSRAHYDLGLLLMESGRDSLGVKELKKAAELDPEDFRDNELDSIVELK